jgi:two-component system chemotaxis response regulator CheV
MAITTAQQRESGILLRSGTNEVEFIEFALGETSFGINVAKVQRVIARKGITITRTDQSSAELLGIIYIQDKPIQLIDLRHLLGMPPSDIPEDRQLIIVTRFNKITTAYLIDAINKIHRTSWTEFEPMENTMGSRDGGYVTGTIKIEDRVILILDLEHLMLKFMPETEQTTEEAPLDKKQKRESVRIIYAEDSPIIRKMMINTLRNGGYTNVSAFPHGKAAYEHLEALRQKAVAEKKSLLDFVDCIITDIEMPQMDGLTLCRQVKEATDGGHIPAVVVFSSLVNKEMAEKCRSVGADAQISKPHGEEILKIVDDLCLQ